MDNDRLLTRSTVTAVWAVALLGLAIWFVLAWGGYALLSEGSEWLSARIDPLVASVVWELRLERLLGWAESIGTITLWAVWALGSIGLLLTAAFATALYQRAQRALSAPR